MSENAIDNVNISKPASVTAKPKGARKAGKKAKSAKKTARIKKAAAKPKGDGTNKKGEVIAMMKRAKGATLAEIMTATGWQPHTVRCKRGKFAVPSRTQARSCACYFYLGCTAL
jgi:hypothetical protein